MTTSYFPIRYPTLTPLQLIRPLPTTFLMRKRVNYFTNIISFTSIITNQTRQSICRDIILSDNCY